MHRSILVIDVEKFGDPARTNAHQVAIRDGLYQALEGALEDTGISQSRCVIEDRGDGALVLISPEVPKSWLVTGLRSSWQGHWAVTTRLVLRTRG